MDNDPDRGHLGGVMRYDGEKWTHDKPPDAPGAVYTIADTPDGSVWFGVKGLFRFDGQQWTRITEPAALTTFIQNIDSADDGGLWVGTRADGVLRYDGTRWEQYGVLQGLADDRADAVLAAMDGTVWVSSIKGISRFDGRTWTTFALPSDLALGVLTRLYQTRDGALWINSFTYRATYEDGKRDYQYESWTTRYSPDLDPPDTEITVSLDEVSQPGNTTLAWTGADPWKATPDEELQYTWRLDGGDWSPYAHGKSRVFELLSSGDHTFEVKTRDRDFNEDPTPAVVQFTVIPPVWQQPWFLGLMAVLLSAIGFQTVRVIRRDQRLQEGNAALSVANKELFAVNQELESANEEIQEQTERKSTFLASMSHELRTPMNAIKGFSSLVLRREKALSDRGKENLEKVDQTSDHLLAMINDLLDLSKIEAGRMDVSPSTFDVKRVVTSACGTVQPLVKDGVTLEMDVEDVEEVYTDEARVRQMLLNLLGNALKFTDEGRVVVRARQDEEQLVLSVSDTGKGIPEDEIPYLFDEYRQVKGSDREHKGTGLGLSITQKFAVLLGGSIGVESEVGKGSVFIVRIPKDYGNTSS